MHRVLLHCAAPGEVGDYACLSHCWGSSQPLRTTLANVDQYQTALPQEKMPQTFQDAIAVTNKLGIQYLWVDSLCIIQDSEEEWQREAARMSEIYANSAVTIAASLASDDSKGLFSVPQDCFRSIAVNTTDANGEILTMFARKTLSHGHGSVPLPLMSRAWVLQERLLSPRILHFTTEEIVWECMNQTTCECGCIRSLWSPGHEPFDKDLLHEPALARASRADLRDKWHRIIEEYSRLSLTLERDRLPAVSGAARRFSFYIGGPYLVGVWQANLIKDLMWERREPVPQWKRLKQVPTWSWASLYGQVMFDRAITTEELAVVIDASCEPLRGDDPYGEVRGGSITLAGLLIQISVIRSLSGESYVWALRCGTKQRLDNAEYVSDLEPRAPEEDLFCIALGVRRGVYRTSFDEKIWLAMTCSDEQKQSYRRAGLLKTPAELSRLGQDDHYAAEVVTTISVT
jgi:hypothetical protein